MRNDMTTNYEMRVNQLRAWMHEVEDRLRQKRAIDEDETSIVVYQCTLAVVETLGELADRIEELRR